MPVENPAARPVFDDGKKLSSLANFPINRGMLSVIKELRERGLGDEQGMAVRFRLMRLGELLGNREAISAFIRPKAGPDELEVSEALIKAYASARSVCSEEGERLDVQDVVRIALGLMNAEARNEDMNE